MRTKTYQDQALAKPDDEFYPLDRYIRKFGRPGANKKLKHKVCVIQGVRGVVVPGDDGEQPWKVWILKFPIAQAAESHWKRPLAHGLSGISVSPRPGLHCCISISCTGQGLLRGPASVGQRPDASSTILRWPADRGI